MTNELDGAIMFNLKILSDFGFHKQRGTILTWTVNGECEEDDTAISFQDKEGVKEIWRIICSIKGVDDGDEDYYKEDEEEYEDEILPEPTTSNLTYIAKEIRFVSILT